MPEIKIMGLQSEVANYIVELWNRAIGYKNKIEAIKKVVK